MSEDPHPIVSTGTDEEGLREVRARWKGRWYSSFLDADSLATYGNKIEGRLRVMAAAYLVLRDGNRCTIRSSFCTQGEVPFEHPESADFDHIEIKEPPDNRLKNLRLACHPCNSHQQKFQWKQNAAAASTRMRESEGSAKNLSTEIDLNVRMYPWYRDEWIERKMKEGHGIPLDEAIFTAAREAHLKFNHGAHQTFRGYLQVLTTGADAPFYIDSVNKLLLRRTKRDGQMQ